MITTTTQSIRSISETYLAPLYWKAMESHRPDAMIKDEKAVASVKQMNLDFTRIKQIKMNELLLAMRIIFIREIDRYARYFLNGHPNAVVVHTGCGFDSRFERVDNGPVEWYDLDLPEIMELRKRTIGNENKRHHLIGCLVPGNDWHEVARVNSRHSFLFLAETVFVYFTEAQVKAAVLNLLDHFHGAELVFDGWRPFEVWRGNCHPSNSLSAGLMQWGFWHGKEIEAWDSRSRLLDEWNFFDQPEPRLNRFHWMAPLSLPTGRS